MILTTGRERTGYSGWAQSAHTYVHTYVQKGTERQLVEMLSRCYLRMYIGVAIIIRVLSVSFLQTFLIFLKLNLLGVDGLVECSSSLGMAQYTSTSTWKEGSTNSELQDTDTEEKHSCVCNRGDCLVPRHYVHIHLCSFQLNAVNLQVNCTIKDNISCCPVYLNHISGLHHLVTHFEQTEHMIHCSGVCCHSMCSVRGGGTHIATHIRFTCNTSTNKSTLNWTLGTILPSFPFRLSNSFHSRGIRMSVFDT